MTPEVRWGLLGTAHINRRLIPAMRAARRSTLVAVASRDADRAQRYAAEWHIPTAHGSYDALLHDQDVDAVYVPLPNALHVAWTIRALDAGKHVLCEKPLALTPADVERVDALARARQRVAAEAFMFRHEPLVEHVCALLAEGVVGTISTISSVFTFEQQRVPDVRLDPALGGGSLWDIGCYPVSLARLIAGREPEWAFGTSSIGPHGVDETFSGLLQFPGGVVATIHSSFRAAYRTALEVTGREGVLRTRHPFKPGPQEQIEIERDDYVRCVTVDGSPLLFVRQVENFVAAALGEREPAVSLRESRGNAAALAALHESARTARPVRI